MISHVIGTMSDKSVFGCIGSIFVKLLYSIKRIICRNINKYIYLYYLQIIKGWIIILNWPIIVSETLSSLLIVLLWLIIRTKKILLKIKLSPFLSYYSYYFSNYFILLSFLFVLSWIEKAYVLLVLQIQEISNSMILLSYYFCGEKTSMRNKNTSLYEIKNNYFKTQKRYYSQSHSQLKKNKEIKENKLIKESKKKIMRSKKKVSLMYKSYYEWLAGVIDVGGIFTLNLENINTIKDISLEVLLLRPHYRVLTAIWLNFGGSIKQVNLLKREQYKEEYKISNLVRSRICMLYNVSNPRGKSIIIKELDFPFCNYLYTYRLNDQEKIKNIINNTLPLIQRKYIKNIYFHLSDEIEIINNMRDIDNIDLDTQWFAGVFDACAILYCDYDNMTITLSNVCKELLIRIRKKFGDIGKIINTEYYLRNDELKASWLIFSHDELLKFSLFMKKYELISEIKYRIKLVEKWLYLQSLRREYEEKNMSGEWIKLIEKFLKEEWYMFSQL